MMKTKISILISDVCKLSSMLMVPCCTQTQTPIMSFSCIITVCSVSVVADWLNWSDSQRNILYNTYNKSVYRVSPLLFKPQMFLRLNAQIINYSHEIVSTTNTREAAKIRQIISSTHLKEATVACVCDQLWISLTAAVTPHVCHVYLCLCLPCVCV